MLASSLFDGVEQFPLYYSFVKNPLICFLCCPRNPQHPSKSFHLKEVDGAETEKVREEKLLATANDLARRSVPDMELGHWVTGSMVHLGHLSRPDHRVIILTRCQTRVFPVFEKMPKMQNVHLKC